MYIVDLLRNIVDIQVELLLIRSLIIFSLPFIKTNDALQSASRVHRRICRQNTCWNESISSRWCIGVGVDSSVVGIAVGDDVGRKDLGIRGFGSGLGLGFALDLMPVFY
jgi:uncharacterized spore protein YtfJ